MKGKHTPSICTHNSGICVGILDTSMRAEFKYTFLSLDAFRRRLDLLFL